MNDILFEQVVPRKSTLKDNLPNILILVGMVLVTLISLLLLGSLFVIVFIVCFLIGYYVIRPKFKTEYEYSLFNEEFTISIIYNKEKRKTKTILNLQEAKYIAPSGAEQLSYYQPTKTVDYSSGMEGAKTYEIIINDGNALCCYLIEPNEEMAKQMKRVVKSNMFLELY